MSKVSVIVPVYNVENYIRDMLRSVQNQTFKDFEVVMVNDGSTDGSLAIMEEFCAGDERFKCFTQANAGVAVARNKGVELACGEFVVFYDPDDYIPPRALEKLYKKASANKADMVVGVMEEKSLGESLIYMHSQKLAKQQRISPTDSHFIGAWSLCHKMFSLEFLRKHGLKVEKLSNAEDGVFTFCALNCTDKIYGRDTVAYNYIKRPFWLTPSATQTISSKYLEGLLASHDRIAEEASKLAAKRLSPAEAEKYLEPLYIRFVEGEMVNGYYRGIWRAEQDLIPRIEERTAMYRTHITDGKWQELLNRNRDLELEKGFFTREQMAAKPVVSVIISADLDEKRFNMILGSVYNQLFPRFEILVSPAQESKVEETYREKLNFRVVDADSPEDLLTAAKGKYVIILDEFVMFTKNSLRLLVMQMDADKSLGFAAMLMKAFDGENYRQIPALSAAYGYTKSGRSKFNKLSYADNLFANKLFRKSTLEGFAFGEHSAEDMMRLYKTLNFRRLRKAMMITDISEESLLARSTNQASGARVVLAYKTNDGIMRSIQALKRCITREDIDRIKGKLRK